MNIKEFFSQVGGEYDEVISRLPSEEMIKKFVLKFLDDPSYSSLKKAYSENNVNDAFLAAHTLKGIATNLGLNSLSKAASELTEELRGANSFPQDSFFENVDKIYKATIEKIKQID